MLSKLILRIGLACVLIWSAAACASATPSPTPTPTVVVPTDVPTATTEPATDTPQPTDASAQSTALPGDQATAAPGAPQSPQASQPAAGNPASTAPLDKYKFVSQNHADKYQVRPGVPIIITWTVQNIGAAAWTADYTANYFAGVKAQTDSVRFGKTVAPNANLTISVTFNTPTVPGDYNMWWKLTNLQGQHFGDVDFSFTVTSTPGKAVPTP